MSLKRSAAKHLAAGEGLHECRNWHASVAARSASNLFLLGDLLDSGFPSGDPLTLLSSLIDRVLLQSPTNTALGDVAWWGMH